MRTHFTALEARLCIPMPAQHPVLCWMVEHSAYSLNKYMVHVDGETAFCKLHGKEPNERLAIFGERSSGSSPSTSGPNLTARGNMAYSWVGPSARTRTLLVWLVGVW